MSSSIDPSLYPRLHEQLADRFGGVVLTLLSAIADALLMHASDGLEANVAAKLSDTARRLREEASVRAEIALERFVGLDLNTLQEEHSLPVTITDLGAPEPGSEIGLLEQILARELANAIRSAFGGGYLHYLRRLETLSGASLRDDQHPLGARAVSLALILSLEPFTHLQPISLHLRPILLAQAPLPLGQLLQDCDHSLREAGILPQDPAASLMLTSDGRIQSPGEAAALSPQDEAYTGIFPTEELQSSFLQHASHQVLNDIRASAVMAANPLSTRHSRLSAHRNATRLPQVEEIERDAVAFAQQHHMVPFSQAARIRFFQQIRQQIVAAGGDTAVLAVIDLVSTLFDYATGDRRLPEGARILLWRLQVPVITLASLDAGYLSDDSRSVRRLIEQLVAISVSYPDEMRPDKALYQRLQTIVRAVEIVAHAFHVRSQVLTAQVDHEYQRATNGMRRLLSSLSRSRRCSGREPRQRRNRRDFDHRPSAARERTVSEDIRRLLDHRLGGNRIPASVRTFLYDVWLRHLRTAVLRDGADSQSYRLALKVVDDLLWTLGQEGADPRARTELVQSIPPMLNMLTVGIREVGARPENFRTFFDEIFIVHLRRMQGEEGSAATIITREMTESEPRTEANQTLVKTCEEAEAVHQGTQAPPSDPMSGVSESRAGRGECHSVQQDSAQLTHRHAPRPAFDKASPDAWRQPPRPVPLDQFPDGETIGVPVDDHASPAIPHPASLSERMAPAGQGSMAPLDPLSVAASREKLQALIRNTRMDDLPNAPRRFNLPTERFSAAMQPGRWMELISRSGRVDYAKVVWLNDRRTMVLLLLAPGKRIMTRNIDSLVRRARQGRLYFVW